MPEDTLTYVKADDDTGTYVDFDPAQVRVVFKVMGRFRLTVMASRS
jgi:hypothetical protein